MKGKDKVHFKCDCEHISHFPLGSLAATGHPYGTEFSVRFKNSVTTQHGQYDVCPACVKSCMPITRNLR